MALLQRGFSNIVLKALLISRSFLDFWFQCLENRFFQTQSSHQMVIMNPINSKGSKTLAYTHTHTTHIQVSKIPTTSEHEKIPIDKKTRQQTKSSSNKTSTCNNLEVWGGSLFWFCYLRHPAWLTSGCRIDIPIFIGFLYIQTVVASQVVSMAVTDPPSTPKIKPGGTSMSSGKFLGVLRGRRWEVRNHRL